MGDQKPGKVHATCFGRKTLCDRVIPADLIYDDSTPPKRGKNVCLRCQKIEAEIKKFAHLLR